VEGVGTEQEQEHENRRGRELEDEDEIGRDRRRNRRRPEPEEGRGELRVPPEEGQQIPEGGDAVQLRFRREGMEGMEEVGNLENPADNEATSDDTISL
jgi:hypothetical protein